MMIPKVSLIDKNFMTCEAEIMELSNFQTFQLFHGLSGAL